MGGRFTRSLIALVLLAVAMEPAMAKDYWRQVTSENFILTGNAEASAMVGLAKDLEIFRQYLQMVTSIKNTVQDQPFRIFIFEDQRSYDKEVRVRGSVGVFRRRLNGSAAFLNGDTDRKPWQLAGRNVLFHEYVHHFLHRFSPLHYPRWFHEGFAEFFATFEVANGQIIVGKPPMWRLFAVRGDDWIPMGRLLNSNFKYQRSRDGLSIFYGQSWLLVHYTQMHEELRPKMAEYLRLVNLGMTNEAALEQTFGKTPKMLMNDLREYWKSQHMVHFIYNIPDDHQEPEVTIRTLSDAETAYYKAYTYSFDATDKSGFKRFEKAVNKLIRKYPDYLPAQLLKAELTLAFGRNANVAALLEAVLEGDPDNVAARAMIGGALINLAAEEEDADRAEALVNQGRTILSAVLEIAPGNFMANYFFGKSFIYVNPDHASTGIEALERAREIHPEDPDVQLMTARAMIKAGQYEIAAAYLRDIVSWALSREQRDAAEELLETLGFTTD